MSREIKFRVWDGQNKRMIPLEDIPPRLITDGTGGWKLIFGSGFHDDDYDSEVNNNDLIIVQYTGMKDCKGKEIYEGDIVRWYIFPVDPDTEEPQQKKYIQDTVAYRHGAFIADKRSELIGIIAPFRHLEIIGNIYENPDF